MASVQGFSRILRTLKQNDLFYSSAFEACIAASYFSRGMEVEIVEESRVPGVKTSDLCVYVHGKPVYVECKSLDDLSRGETRLWEQMITRLTKGLRRYKRCWVVSIYASSKIDGRTMENVCRQVNEDIRCGIMETRIVGTTIRIEYSNICKWETEHPLPLVFHNTRQAPLGCAEADVYNKNWTGFYRNPRMVQIFPFEGGDIRRRLLAEIKRARSQLPREGPGIVHLEIPLTVGPRFLKVVDDSWESVFRTLNKDTKRINAIVLTGTLFQADPQLPISQNYYLIPHLEPRNGLPRDFSPLGVNPWLPSHTISDIEGTVEFTVTVPYTWRPSLSLNLLFWTSRHGKQQLYLWRTWDGTLRFDLFLPGIGRVCVQGSKEGLRPGGTYCFAGTWSEKHRKVCLYMNGRKIGQTNLH